MTRKSKSQSSKPQLQPRWKKWTRELPPQCKRVLVGLPVVLLERFDQRAYRRHLKHNPGLRYLIWVAHNEGNRPWGSYLGAHYLTACELGKNDNDDLPSETLDNLEWAPLPDWADVEDDIVDMSLVDLLDRVVDEKA
jgi:hypothetical protein